MKLEEFLDEEEVADVSEVESEEAEAVPEELDVQKAVVESLAADKVARDEEIKRLNEKNESLRMELAAAKAKCDSLVNQIGDMKKSLQDVGEILARNSDSEMSSKIALLDRNIECDDRFPGETRDHVLEILREARDRDEAEGRCRRAQLIEGVLAANESNGTLAKRRAELEKLFNDNSNVISGHVIEELKKLGISHKHGEEYLLPSEIIKRTY